MTNSDLGELAKLLRVLCADMVENAGSGHPGMPMGMADVAAVLFANHLKFDPSHPEWLARDRFVLSSGHGSALAYALLHLTGSPTMTIEELRRLRRKGSLTPGHPEFGHTPGIECTTGPLGQGLATAVGMAIAERKLAAELGEQIAGHRIFVMAGDGCLMEGISHEAAALAGHLKLSKLTVLFDDNAISIDGPIGITSSEDVLSRFESYGWSVIAVDGHSAEKIDDVLLAAQATSRPCLIACKTSIGMGAPSKAGTAGIHGSPLGASEIDAMRQALGWGHAPFELPDDLMAKWRACGDRGKSARNAWIRALTTEPQPVQDRVAQIEQRRPLAPGPDLCLAIRKAALGQTKPKATRVSSKDVLDQLVAACPWLLGGSADLSGSNGTRGGSHTDFGSEQLDGNYLRYGIREHGMAAAMNGIALTGAHVPYGGTFLVFSDYCRPAIRLAALMGLKVIYVFTHDSIGLGEDGPTHQPVEHLASLRLIPSLNVFRPADAVEVAECWELALKHNGPSVLALSRQDVPLLRSDAETNRSAAGGYAIAGGDQAADVVMVATGSELSIAMAARDLLAAKGCTARVVSVPCLDTLEAQPRHVIDGLLGSQDTLRVSIEAGATLPWRALLGPESLNFGVDAFGESASAAELYESFSLTPQAIAEAILSHRSAN